LPNYETPRAILIEGVECAGKTTLIRELRDGLPWDCKSLSHRAGHQFDRFIHEYALGVNVVFNRGHYSEIVYSRLWNRGTPFSDPEEAVLNDYVSRHILVVLCTADVATLQARYDNRYYRQRARCSDLAQICGLFDQALCAVPHLRYTSTDDVALAEIVARIRRELQTSLPVSEEPDSREKGIIRDATSHTTLL
jgi:hypothetical protein